MQLGVGRPLGIASRSCTCAPATGAGAAAASASDLSSVSNPRLHARTPSPSARETPRPMPGRHDYSAGRRRPAPWPGPPAEELPEEQSAGSAARPVSAWYAPKPRPVRAGASRATSARSADSVRPATSPNTRKAEVTATGRFEAQAPIAPRRGVRRRHREAGADPVDQPSARVGGAGPDDVKGRPDQRHQGHRDARILEPEQQQGVSGNRKKVIAARATTGRQKRRTAHRRRCAGRRARSHRPCRPAAPPPQHHREHDKATTPGTTLHAMTLPHACARRRKVPRGERAQHGAEMVGGPVKAERAPSHRLRRHLVRSSHRAAAVRRPLPTRSMTRNPMTCHAAPATAISGRTRIAVP